MKARFVKFMSSSHLKFLNISLYEGDGWACLREENVVNNKSKGKIEFRSVEEAEEWYAALPGSGLGRLANAIERISISI